MIKSERPQLKLFNFGDPLRGLLALMTGLHNQSARAHGTYEIDPALFQRDPLPPVNQRDGFTFEHQSEEKIYRHTVPRGDVMLRTSILSAPTYDGAIWFTDAAQLTDEHTALLRILHHSRVQLLIFLALDAHAPEEERDLLERALRGHCEEAGLNGNELKILRGDSTPERAVQALSEACDELFFPRQPPASSFFMPVEDVFDIKRKGLVVTGQVQRGIVKIGQALELLGIRPARQVTAIAVESFRKARDFAEAGMNIGVMLRGVSRIEIERGQALAQPGTMQVSNLFEAEVYFYPPPSGPRYPPLLGQPFDLVLYTWRGQATLTAGELVSGGLSHVTIRTAKPIAIEALAPLMLVAENRSAGLGIVTAIFDSARFL